MCNQIAAAHPCVLHVYFGYMDYPAGCIFKPKIWVLIKK